MWKYLKFRLRRRSRRLRQNMRLWRLWLLHYLQRHIYGSWQKLGQLRWPFLVWILIILISFIGLINTINGYDNIYLADAPAHGGNYIEGMVGSGEVINPIYAQSTTEQDLETLIFAGLTRQSPKNQPEADLAKNWEISSDRKTYTFNLRDGLVWQDGQPLTAEDVAFTVDVIQDPNSKSPLANDWKGVRYEVVGPQTIRFTLPNTFSNFLYNTTVGIIPKHLLSSVKRSNLRLHEFSQNPVGSGPYQFDGKSSDGKTIKLKAFGRYHFGRPYIESFRYRLYETTDDMISGYAKSEIQGMGKVDAQSLDKLRSIGGLNLYQLKQPAYVAVFFNTSRAPYNNPELRRAITQATNRGEIIGDTLQGTASQQTVPLDATMADQPQGIGLDTATAKASIAKLGAGQQTLRLTTVRGGSYEQVARSLQRQWQDAGLKIDLDLRNADDFGSSVLRSRNYDMVLYGQNVSSGDVYSFWHSSQAEDPGLNLSEYKNTDADRAIEAARLSQDLDYKKQKYSVFVAQWSKDAPAVVLYSPFYYYAQSKQIHGFDLHQITKPSERFYDVQLWYIKAIKQLRAVVQ